MYQFYPILISEILKRWQEEMTKYIIDRTRIKVTNEILNECHKLALIYRNIEFMKNIFEIQNLFESTLKVLIDMVDSENVNDEQFEVICKIFLEIYKSILNS